MGKQPIVVCVLRSSKDFTPDYVDRLAKGVNEHLPDARFVCLSDVPVPCERWHLTYNWPGWWSKMELFRPDLEGDFLYFDLDTMIIGSLKHFVRVTSLTMLSDFFWPDRIASGVMFLPEKDRHEIWTEWIKDPEGHMAWCKNFDDRRAIGDQKWLGKILGTRPERWQNLLPGQVVSYKVHVRKKQLKRETGNGFTPREARVVCFHGKPRPKDINWRLPPTR